MLALYEGKLAELRAFAASTPLAADGDRREALRAWVIALKEEELRIGFDFALFDAVHHYGRLASIGARHAEAMALATAARARQLGSTWSDAARPRPRTGRTASPSSRPATPAKALAWS